VDEPCLNLKELLYGSSTDYADYTDEDFIEWISAREV